MRRERKLKEIRREYQNLEFSRSNFLKKDDVSLASDDISNSGVYSVADDVTNTKICWADFF